MTESGKIKTNWIMCLVMNLSGGIGHLYRLRRAAHTRSMTWQSPGKSRRRDLRPWHRKIAGTRSLRVLSSVQTWLSSCITSPKLPHSVLHHLPPIPVSVLRDLTQLPDSELQSQPPVPARCSPLRNQDKSTIGRLRSFVCIADDAPEKRVNVSVEQYFVTMHQKKYLKRNRAP